MVRDTAMSPSSSDSADYDTPTELAPEYIWPSQIIETLAGYSYLVNKLGINPGRICICGDSAGANIILSTLLHLARPSPEINLPTSYGIANLAKPGAALIISPEVKIVSGNPSRLANEEFDVIEDRAAVGGGLDYVGGSRDQVEQPSFWPQHLFYTPKHEFDVLDHDPHGPRLPSEPKVRNSTEAKRLRDRLASPYVQPGYVKDVSWWKEALPEQTMVVYGGKVRAPKRAGI
jgi:acetyl esterase/lipase